MKNLRLNATLALILTPAATLVAQTGTWRSADILSTKASTARCAYAPTDSACKQSGTQSPSASNGKQNASPCPLAPCSRPSQCCPSYYPRPSGPPFVFSPESGTHAAAGALIGFGLGAAAGAAKHGDGGTRFVAAVFVGGFGALMGAVIGHGIPSNAFRRHHRRYENLEDDVGAKPLVPPHHQGSATAGPVNQASASWSAAVSEQPSSP